MIKNGNEMFAVLPIARVATTIETEFPVGCKYFY